MPGAVPDQGFGRPNDAPYGNRYPSSTGTYDEHLPRQTINGGALPPTLNGVNNGVQLDREPRPSVDDRSGRSREHRNESPGGTRSRSRTKTGTQRICKKCNEPLTGQFVRALGGTFHLDCFKCRVGTAHFESPAVLMFVLGLRRYCCLEILPCRS